MKPLSVVVFQSNRENAESLAKALFHHFRSVKTANDLPELRRAIPQNRADVAVIDLESLSLNDVLQLHQEFAATNIVCTHRLADEGLWTKALSAGAIDCCMSSDVRAIVLAAANVTPMWHNHVA